MPLGTMFLSGCLAGHWRILEDQAPYEDLLTTLTLTARSLML